MVKKALKAANRFVHKHHKSVGIVATIVVMVHMIVCIGPLHHPSATGFIALGLMLLLVMNGKRKIRKNWLHVHRSLAAALSVVLVVHVLGMTLVA